MGCGFESHRAHVSDAYLYAGVRTPFGRYAGGLAGTRPDDLAATVVRGVLDRAPDLDPARVDELVFGCANGAGEDNRNVGRMAGLLAGLPVTVPGVTVNRLCGSSLQAAMDASRLVETGDAKVVVAGGVESMSRAPWVLPKPTRGFPAGHETLVSTTLGWRLVNARMPAEWTVSLGECNEQLADELGIDRDRQDAFAVASHRRAAQAWDDGFYDELVLPVGDVTRDECIRADAGTESLAGLKPAFRPDGTITAGNASPLNDGAAALLVGAEDAGIGIAPVARFAGRGVAALEPQRFGVAPVEAAARALAAAGIGWSDVGAVELNEAFAVQSLACIDAWAIDPDLVNTRGGAIAIGHPLGASGARVLSTLAAVLVERRQRWGLAAICIGVGQGLAVVLENVAGPTG
jgi:acetyl-CoA acyltransferase